MFLSMARTSSEYILLFSLVILGVMGLYGGYLLMTDPTGITFGISIYHLQGTAFDNYLLPGFALFLFCGVLPLVVCYYVWNKYVFTWRVAGIVGTLVLFVTLAVIDNFGYQTTPPLQILYGATGLIIIICTLFFKPKYYS